MKENWYVAFFDGNTENEYDKFSNDEEAINGFKYWAENNGDTLLEIYECNDDECLTPRRKVY